MQRISFKDSGFTREEWRKLESLSTPKKIQDFLSDMPFNFERKGETHTSVRETLKARRAHCFEGALVAAAALWIQGRQPLLLDLKSDDSDLDHVVTLFYEDSKSTGSRFWGAISKTSHAVLRYRDPIYKSVRELAMSYFHEYFLNTGKKTLRSFSKPFDLSKHLSKFNWLTTEADLEKLADTLDRSLHTKILTPKQVRNLRKADKIEIRAGKIIEH